MLGFFTYKGFAAGRKSCICSFSLLLIVIEIISSITPRKIKLLLSLSKCFLAVELHIWGRHLKPQWDIRVHFTSNNRARELIVRVVRAQWWVQNRLVWKKNRTTLYNLPPKFCLLQFGNPSRIHVMLQKCHWLIFHESSEYPLWPLGEESIHWRFWTVVHALMMCHFRWKFIHLKVHLYL